VALVGCSGAAPDALSDTQVADTDEGPNPDFAPSSGADSKESAQGVLVEDLLPGGSGAEKQGFAGAYVGLFNYGGRIYYSNGDAYCIFRDPIELAYLAGVSPAQVPVLGHIPVPNYHGVCGLVVRPGLFRVGGGVYFSNGSAFCGFTSWEHYVRVTRRWDLNGVPAFNRLPVMSNHGACRG
jgi:hypothetical protein